MKTHNISLESITPDGLTKFGVMKKSSMKVKVENDELHIPAEASKVGKSRHHVYVPGKYSLPFCVNMTVKARAVQTSESKDTPPLELNLYIGSGKVHFEGGHISSNDILTAAKTGTVGDSNLTSFVHYNDIPTKEYVDISVMFGSRMMWVKVDGQYCYVSKKMPYIELMKNNTVPTEFADGLDFSICGGTYTKLTIKSLTVTEYENDEPSISAEIANLPEMSQFELYVKGLPPELHDEMFKTDEFFMRDMKSSLKFKRTIDKHGHLTYQSPCGFQYGMTYFGTHERHGTNWVQSPKKPDYTSDVLNKLAESSPKLANELFSNIQICNPHARECKRRTTIEFKGESRQVCRGSISLKWNPSGFEDLRQLVAAASEVMRATKG